MRKWLALGLLALAGAVEAQPLTGGLLGRGASYGSFIPPATATTGCVGLFLGSPLSLGCTDLVYTVANKSLDVTDGRVQAATIKAIPLPAAGSVTVTPTLSKVGTITTVAGASLADGDYFTVEYAAGNTVPVEFDATPGDGTTGGRVPYVFAPGDTADQIRDGLITLLNTAAGASLTASSGGAATVALVLDTPGAVGGTNTENVANAGFTVAGFADPTHATTVTYQLQACTASGACTAAGADSTTNLSTATLSTSNLLRLSWSAVSGAAYYIVYRKVAPTTPATTGIVYTGTALTVDDTGLAGGGETASGANETGAATVASYWLSALNTAPAAANSACTLGEIRWTATHVYLCSATDTWVRAALATWP